jgi:Zn-dependent protease with chaperone function
VHASAQDGPAYRRSVALFASLGYAWVVGCVLAALGTVWSLAAHLLDGAHGPWLLAGLVPAAVLLWCGAGALWCRLERPPGLRLTPAEAPALFETLERIRKQVEGPALHEVVLGAEMEVRIRERPRWGLAGGVRHCLVIGLPLLMALDSVRLQALLAHEYGHLRRDHGRFPAWVYRTRGSWARLHAWVLATGGAARDPAEAFLAWYFPRFLARSFALARQDEYEADRISARLLGGEVAAAALTEVALRSDWLRQEFWPAHWALAAQQELPAGPYACLRRLLRQPLPQDFARRALRQQLRGASTVADTHPALRERLEGLGIEPRVPAWSQRAALDHLGAQVNPWIVHFDRQWSREHAPAWKQHHAALRRVQARVEELEAAPDKDAEAWTELGDLQRRLNAPAAARSCYGQALALVPGHAAALKGLHGCLGAEQAAQRLACLERLHEASPQYRWWAAQAAVAQLQEQDGPEAAVVQRWQERLEAAEEAESRAWAQLGRQPFLVDTAAPDLNAFQRRELEAELARWPEVRCAWLVRRPVREFPGRRCYLLVVELEPRERAEALALCDTLEGRLRLPGPALVVWSGESPELAGLRRGRPLYDARVLL